MYGFPEMAEMMDPKRRTSVEVKKPYRLPYLNKGTIKPYLKKNIINIDMYNIQNLSYQSANWLPNTLPKSIPSI